MSVPTIYVDGTNGTDNANGTLNNPLRSIVAAEAELVGETDWHIRVLDNRPFDQPFDAPLFREPEGVGYVTFDKTVDVIGPTAALAGSDDKKIVASGLTEKALVGASVEVLSGAATGTKRTIPHNGTSDIVLAAYAEQSIAEGDTYRVFRPAPGSKMLHEGTEPLVYSEGAPLKPPGLGRDYTPSVRFVNSRLALRGVQGASLGQDESYLSLGATLGLFGCELSHADGHAFLELRASQLLMGRIGWDFVEAPEGMAPTPGSWAGWGAFFDGCFPVWNDVVDFISGFLVADRYVTYTGRHEITGALLDGWLNASGENNAAQTSAPVVSFGKIPPFLPRVAPARVNNTQGMFGAALSARQGASLLIGEDTIIDSVSNCIQAGGAYVRAMGDLAFGSGVDGVRVFDGGEFVRGEQGVSFSGAANLTGDQISVGNTPATGLFTDYDTSGSFLKDTAADDNSIFRCI